jgi:hypothetical protein
LTDLAASPFVYPALGGNLLTIWETQVAKELAEAKIPLILTKNRGAPAEFRHKDAVVGPPLTPSVAKYLTEAGVLFAIAIASEST